MTTINLKALSKEEVRSFFHRRGLPAFRAKQLLHWMYEKDVSTIQEITEFSRDLREKLSDEAYISTLDLLEKQTSRDGTEKFLLRFQDGETTESVLIADADRLTLCISSQAGCAMGCRFCLTGTLGFKRNLRAHEIVDQIISAGRSIAPQRITNIVFMGMGEPLANFENVVEALWRMTDLMRISPRRITLSTVGVAPRILELAENAPMVNLAVSLNATTDEVRDLLMPVNKTYPLRELIGACRNFPLPPRRRITFEYVLLKGVNDTRDDAKRLVKLLRGIPSKINLIPFNPYEGAEFQRPGEDRVLAFQEILLEGNMTAIIRKSKGQDILAACGQLKARYELRDGG